MNATPLKHVLLDPDTPASVLLFGAGKLFGSEEFLYWDPETLTMEFQDELGKPLPDRNFNKLMAAIEMVVSDAFWRDLPTFIRLCNAISGVAVYDFDPADAGEIALAIIESMIIWPPDRGEPIPFAPKILAYIEAALADEGVATPPDILKLTTNAGTPPDVAAEYADDPTMFGAITEQARAKTDELNALVKTYLQLTHKLLEQVASDQSSAVKVMLAAIGMQEASGAKLRPPV